MRIYRGLDRYPPDAPPSVVAQGTFDGVHVGHQAVIRTAVERARALGARAVALTFDPLPATVLRPAEAPPEILPLEERLEQILALGADAVVVIPFTPEFSRVEADPFVGEVLGGVLKAREVVVGFNHTFGRGARGTPDVLVRAAAPLGLRVHVVPPHRIDGALVSSSAVRQALRAGEVARAAGLLGRPYTIRGRVSRGAQRGRTLGFPTANLVPPGQWLLAPGVYAGRASWEEDRAAAVINVGVRPTFGETGLVAEAHLLDVSPDLYDRVLTIAFLARIRDEMRFGSIDALRARIQEDVAVGRRLLAGAPPR
jgi:riboflavin kinase/FMN adenylyltransferase